MRKLKQFSNLPKVKWLGREELVFTSSHLTSATGLLTITLCAFSLEMRFHCSDAALSSLEMCHNGTASPLARGSPRFHPLRRFLQAWAPPTQRAQKPDSKNVLKTASSISPDRAQQPAQGD